MPTQRPRWQVKPSTMFTVIAVFFFVYGIAALFFMERNENWTVHPAIYLVAVILNFAMAFFLRKRGN